MKTKIYLKIASLYLLIIILIVPLLLVFLLAYFVYFVCKKRSILSDFEFGFYGILFKINDLKNDLKQM